MLKTFQETIQLQTADCDMTATWRPSAILTEMQEISNRHCTALHIGREDLLMRNIVWVLARTSLQMDRYPTIGEKIQVETFPTPVRHRFFPRYYTFTDSTGTVIGKASTLWLLMDLATRQSVLLSDVADLSKDNGDLTPSLPMPGNIAPLSGEGISQSYQCQYTDLDFNGHVNNTRYADWLCNRLGIETLRQFQIASLILHYNLEVLPEHQLTLTLRHEDRQFQLSALAEGQLRFEAGGTLVPRAMQE